MPISPPALIGEKFITQILVLCNDCLEDMVTFMALAKTTFFCNTRVAGLVNFYLAKIFTYSTYNYMVSLSYIPT